MQFRKVVCAGIPHRCPQATHELMQHAENRSLIRHLPLDPLWHELKRICNVALEIAVGQPRAMAASDPMPR